MTTEMEKRFKRYEAVTDLYLVRRTPVIARLDGRAFHTLTRGMEKPFCDKFIEAMQLTAYAVAGAMQGCRLAYVQSDEISFLLIDYHTIQSEPWFDYRVNKMTSIAASVATRVFGEKIGKPCEFDARFFNLPENDVCNYFVYRQRDAERNSLNMLAQAHYSQKELLRCNAMDMHEMLHRKGVNWANLPEHYKRGWAIHRDAEGYWIPGAPEFSKDRNYIESLIPTV